MSSLFTSQKLLLLVVFLLYLILIEVKSDVEKSDFEILDELDELSSSSETCASCGPKTNRRHRKPRNKNPEKEKIYKEYLEKIQQQQEQEELMNKLPKEKFGQLSDTAYKSINDIPEQILVENIQNKMFGCGLTFIPNGKFIMGSIDNENYEEDGENQLRKIKIVNKKNKDLGGFYMEKCEITNGQFLQFWDENKKNDYSQTEAERYEWSFVFELLVSKELNKDIHSAVKGIS